MRAFENIKNEKFCVHSVTDFFDSKHFDQPFSRKMPGGMVPLILNSRPLSLISSFVSVYIESSLSFGFSFKTLCSVLVPLIYSYHRCIMFCIISMGMQS